MRTGTLTALALVLAAMASAPALAGTHAQPRHQHTTHNRAGATNGPLTPAQMREFERLYAKIQRARQGQGAQAMPDTTLPGAANIPPLATPPAKSSDLKAASAQKTPLSVKQIIQLRKHNEEIQRAEHQNIAPVIPIIKTTLINLATMQQPPVLRLREGFSTTIVFEDSTGAPFSVKPLGFGDQKAYKVKKDSPNVLTLFATDAYRASNMTVQLAGVDTPLVIHLVNGGHKVDYIRHFEIEQLSPATRKALALKANQSDPTPVVNDPAMTSFLDDVPPKSASVVPVLEPGVEAWWYHHHLIVRTRYTLESPDGTPIHGQFGWTVYDIRHPASLLLFLKHGNNYWVHVVLDQVPDVADVGRADGGGDSSSSGGSQQ